MVGALGAMAFMTFHSVGNFIIPDGPNFPEVLERRLSAQAQVDF
jgi:hypothetical protein